MRQLFGALIRRVTPTTSYPLSRRSSARYEPSCPVIPVISARLVIRMLYQPGRSEPWPGGSGPAQPATCRWERARGNATSRRESTAGQVGTLAGRLGPDLVGSGSAGPTSDKHADEGRTSELDRVE